LAESSSQQRMREIRACLVDRADSIELGGGAAAEAGELGKMNHIQ
jgi:hypothetical protein